MEKKKRLRQLQFVHPSKDPQSLTDLIAELGDILDKGYDSLAKAKTDFGEQSKQYQSRLDNLSTLLYCWGAMKYMSRDCQQLLDLFDKELPDQELIRELRLMLPIIEKVVKPDNVTVDEYGIFA